MGGQGGRSRCGRSKQWWRSWMSSWWQRGDQGQDVGREGRGAEEDARDAGTDAGTNQATEFNELIKPRLSKKPTKSRKKTKSLYICILKLLSCLPPCTCVILQSCLFINHTKYHSLWLQDKLYSL